MPRPDPPTAPAAGWPRRRVLRYLGVLGLGSVAFRRALTALAEGEAAVTSAMIEQAEWIAGIDLTDEERELMLEGVNDLLADYAAVREVELPNAVPPAFGFSVYMSPEPVREVRAPVPLPPAGAERPASEDELAFVGIGRLAAMLRKRTISSVELTRICLERLKRYDPQLQCVINLTEARALRSAELADRELAKRKSRGPLHGIPWGAKDLLAVSGYPTTWGAAPYREQQLEHTAAAVHALDRAGAVLTAKLALGALAWGDVWYGGTTKNPWKLDQGSSGSSAGPASATAAGLVPFAIGSETWGSIVSPCTRCGVTGLRPTFGRVSRTGAMALSWTMDKLGPIARSAEDCALVFSAIHGRDPFDPSTRDAPFAWPPTADPRQLRLGYVPALFEEDLSQIENVERRKRAEDWRKHDLATLSTLRELGFELIPVELPDDLPVSALSFILTAEASAAFDGLTRSGRDERLVRQVARAWPNVFRQGQTIPAVEYIRANRIRRMVMEQTERALGPVDAFVAPTYGGDHLLRTNLTGHPSVVLPNGFRESDGTPTSITFTGRAWQESKLLAIARLYQEATDFHRRRPTLPDPE